MTTTRATERLASLLREARERHTKTQEHLAAEADVSIQTVRRAESTGVVSAESLRALCAVLGLDAVELKEQISRADGKEPSDLISPPKETRYDKQRDRLHIIICASVLACFFATIFWFAFIADAMDIFNLHSKKLYKTNRNEEIIFVSFIYNIPSVAAFCSYFFGHPIQSYREKFKPWFIGATMLLISGFVMQFLGYSDFGFLTVNTTSSFTLLFGCIRPAKHALAAITSMENSACDAFYAQASQNIEKLRALVAHPIGHEEVAQIHILCEETARSAATAQRADAVCPLIYLADDVARGLSPRKKLSCYLDVAESLCAKPSSVSKRRIRDATIAVEQFRIRSSMFCG